MCCWRAEDGQDPVAHEPGYRALIAFDSFNELLKGLVHDIGPDFWVQSLGHCSGAGDVTKEHGHDPALVLVVLFHSFSLPYAVFGHWLLC
jgi:hypothetical protein